MGMYIEMRRWRLASKKVGESRTVKTLVNNCLRCNVLKLLTKIQDLDQCLDQFLN